MKTQVFVDGFNLYNGVALPLSCKWVDLRAYFQSEFSIHEIDNIVFCTSWVLGPTVHNQHKYVDALKSTGVQVELGVFEHRPVKCALKCERRDREFQKPIEKRTDVMLGSLMVLAAAKRECDQIVLVSGDSDFIPAVKICRDQGVHVHVHVPSMPKAYNEYRAKLHGERNPGAFATQIRSAASSHSNLNLNAFLKSQFEVEFESSGVKHKMPGDWKRQSPHHYQRILSKLSETARKSDKNRASLAAASEMAAQDLKAALGLDSVPKSNT